MSVLIVFVVTLTTHYAAVLLLYSSYIRRAQQPHCQHTNRTKMEIHLGLICRYPYHFSQHQPIRVKWEETSYVQHAVCHSITVKTSYDTCRVTNVLPVIGSKFAKNSSSQTKQTKPGVPALFSIQKQVRCDAGQSQGSWRVVCTRFLNVPVFGTKVTRYT